MAGQSGHNLSISKSKKGAPRFPFERPDAGDGYAASGPCLVRKMTPEEMARYGPPAVPKDRALSRGVMAFVVKNATSLEHAAKMARVSAARMKKEMARHCIAAPEGWKEEIEEMSTVESTESGSLAPVESTPNSKDQAPEGDIKVEPVSPEQGARPKTRLEVAREKLSREQYQDLKKGGFSDKQVCKECKIAHDVLIQLKRKWGIEIKPIIPSRKQKLAPEAQEKSLQPDPSREESNTGPVLPSHAEESKEAPSAQATATGLTIAQAIELREELSDDLECYENILKVADTVGLTDRVIQALTWQRDTHQQVLARIDEVFNGTVVQL